jgi:hypothetical protein
MPLKYTQEQLWKSFEKLPEELKTAVFSNETADIIWNTCDKNDIQEVPKVAEKVGYVLMGIIPPEDFQKTLEKEIQIEKEKSKKAAYEINRLIFYPVKTALESLFTIKTNLPSKKSVKIATESSSPKLTEEESLEVEEKTTTETEPQPSGKPLNQPQTRDSYREIVE